MQHIRASLRPWPGGGGVRRPPQGGTQPLPLPLPDFPEINPTQNPPRKFEFQPHPEPPRGFHKPDPTQKPPRFPKKVRKNSLKIQKFFP